MLLRSSRMLAAGCAITVWTLATSSSPPGRAQSAARDPDALRTAFDRYQAMAQVSPYRNVRWQYIGPINVSGRATDVDVADTPAGRRIYAAFATSGVWASDDSGTIWRAIFEDQASTSIGDIAVAPSNPSIVWVGTGEANLFRASMPGAGVYRSTDSGRTFAHAGLSDTQTIARILVHPANPDIVYVAASGHAWTENEMRGVFKTTDGGRSWTRVLYKGPQAGAIDLVMDPRDPNTLYAATWQRVRRKWSDPRVETGFDQSGIWKSTDAGRSWTDAASGLPAPQFRGRIGLDVARSDPNVLYAFLDNYEAGRPARDGERDAYGRPIVEARIKGAEIYRSDDKGATWRKVSESNDFMRDHSGTYGWVFGQIRVDPADENTIYTLGLGLNVSRDAGRTFTTIRGTHGDHHGLWIDPRKPATLYSANDGGIYLSDDAGRTWRYATRAGGVQFYNVVLDTSAATWAYGSIQDDGSRRGRLDLRQGRDRIPAVEWTRAPGGEGSHHAIDPGNPNVIFSHGFYGNFTRTDVGARATGPPEPAGAGAPGGAEPSPEHAAEAREPAAIARGQRQPSPAGTGRDAGRRAGGRGRAASIAIRPRIDGSEAELRAQWMAPIIASVHEPGVIYAGYQYVYRSASRGDSWERISPDLTANDPSRMLLKSSSAIPFQTITALAESPRRRGLLYAGTDDGRLHVTTDDGRTWTDLTSRVPTGRWYSRVVPSHHADGTVYVTQRGREDDDFGVYVYKSVDFGRTFTSLAANIPAGSVNVIREDPASPDVLYLGTDFGAFISTNGGARWDVLGGGLPSVQVADLAYQPRDRIIVVATYGRGMYALDAMKVRD